MLKSPPPPTPPDTSIPRPQGFYNDLIEIAGLGLWVFSAQGGTSYVNRPMAEMLGYTEEEMMTLPLSTFLDEEGMALGVSRWEARKQNQSDSHELRLRRRDGTDFWVLVSGKPVFDRNGVFQGAITMMVDINERKRAEQERDRNHRLLQTILDNVPDIIYLKDVEGRMLTVNKAVEKLRNMSPEAYIGRAHSEIATPALAEGLRRADVRIVAHGETLQTENTVEIDGAARTFLTQQSPYRNEAGEVVGIIGVSREITARKRAEEALRASEERYRSILETIQDGYYELDPEWNFLLVNDALARLFGLASREEMANFDRHRFFSEETLARFDDAFRQVRDSREPISLLEFEFRDVSGARRWATASISPLFDDEGKVAKLRGIIRDVTERVLAREALRQSEERYRAMVENIQEGYYEVDLRGNFTFCNDPILRIYGLTRENYTKVNYKDYAGEVADRVYQAFNQVYRTGEPLHDLSYEMTQPGRGRVAVEFSVVLIRDETGTPTGFRGVVRDITQRVEAERAIRDREQQFRMMFENAIDSIAIFDTNWNFLDANPALLGHIGLTLEELRTRNVVDFVPPDSRERYRSWTERLLREGSARGKFEFALPDGSSLIGEYTATANFRPGQCLMIIRDITEQERAMRALEESEHRFRAIFDNTLDGILILDDELRYQDANPAALTILGLSAENLAAHGASDFVSSDNAEGFREFVHLMKRNGRAEGVFTRPIQDRETTLTFKIVANFLPGLHVAAFQDISDRVRDERLMRAQLEVLQMIAEAKPLEDIFDSLVQMIEDVSISYGGCLLLLDEAREFLVLKAATRNSGFRREDGLRLLMSGNAGSCGTAIRTGVAEFVHDIASDSRFSGIQEPFMSRGYRSSFSTPIRNSEGVVLGTIGILFREQRELTAWEIQFAENLTNLARIALEKSRAEARLRESEAKFRAMTEKSADGIALIGADGRQFYASSAYERILGYQPEEILGNLAQERAHPEDRERVVRVAQALIGSPGASVTIEHRSCHKDGSWRWLETTFTNLLEDPNVRAAVMNFRDISERKQAELALKASEELFSKAFNLSPCTISITSMVDGCIVLVNDTWVRESGYTREELIGRDVRAFELWDDVAERRAFLRELRETGAVREFSASLRMKNGDVRHGLLSAEIIEWNGEKCLLTVAMDLTERLRTEEALRATEKRFSTAFNAGPHPMAIFSIEDRKFVDVNDALLRKLGWTARDVVGHDTRQIGLWAEPEDRGRFYDALLRDRQVDEFETRLCRRDGMVREFLLSARLFELSGREFGLAVATDVTERKQTEARLWASETRFAKAFNASPIPISISSVSDGRFINVNDAWLKAMNYAREEIIGRTSAELNFGVQGADRREMIARARTENGIRGQEFNLRLRNGERRTFLAAIEILELGGEEVLLIASQDITHRKQMEDEVRESRERYKAIFEHSFAGICRTTLDGRILECNEAMARMFGFDSPEELKTANALDLYDARSDRQAALEKMLANRRFQNLERRMRRKDGSPIWTLSNGTVFESGIWREPVIEGVFLDITDRKLTEEELRRSREQLRAASARMETVREEERKAIAREIHDELGQLMTGLKLDIAWIDKRVKLIAEDALREQLGPKMVEMASLLETTIQTVRTIASQLRPGALDALGLAAAIQWQATEFAKRSGIRCETALCREPRGFSIERSIALFRILQEILTNVTRHAHASHVRIELLDADNLITLIVSDDGVGIPDEKIHDQSSLGLLGMRERVLSFQGRIDIERQPESGTRVTVRIPHL